MNISNFFFRFYSQSFCCYLCTNQLFALHDLFGTIKELKRFIHRPNGPTQQRLQFVTREAQLATSFFSAHLIAFLSALYLFFFQNIFRIISIQNFIFNLYRLQISKCMFFFQITKFCITYFNVFQSLQFSPIHGSSDN